MEEFNLEEVLKDIENKENLVDNELKEIFEEKSKLLSDDISIAKTFLICFDILDSNIDKKILIDFLEINKNLRHELKDYEEGKGYNDYVIKLRIKEIINLNRNKIIKFLESFNKVFISLD